MSEIEDFAAWARDMSQRNRARESAREASQIAQSYHQDKQHGCGRLIGMAFTVAYFVPSRRRSDDSARHPARSSPPGQARLLRW